MSLETIPTRSEETICVWRCDRCGAAGTVWDYEGLDLCGRCLTLAEEREADRRRAGRGGRGPAGRGGRS